jgi:tetratricopeptide (TPR) repeat protein
VVQALMEVAQTSPSSAHRRALLSAVLELAPGHREAAAQAQSEPRGGLPMDDPTEEVSHPAIGPAPSRPPDGLWEPAVGPPASDPLERGREALIAGAARAARAALAAVLVDDPDHTEALRLLHVSMELPTAPDPVVTIGAPTSAARWTTRLLAAAALLCAAGWWATAQGWWGPSRPAVEPLAQQAPAATETAPSASPAPRPSTAALTAAPTPAGSAPDVPELPAPEAAPPPAPAAPAPGPSTRIAQGWSALDAGDAAAALRRFEQALAADPSSGAARYGLGYTAEQHDQAERAFDHYCRALTDPRLAQDVQREVQGRLRALGQRCPGG